MPVETNSRVAAAPGQQRSRTVEFSKKKETPGCVVYQEDEVEGQPIVIGSLYVKKWFAGSAESMTVTITKGLIP